MNAKERLIQEIEEGRQTLPVERAMLWQNAYLQSRDYVDFWALSTWLHQEAERLVNEPGDNGMTRRKLINVGYLMALVDLVNEEEE